jgi:cyclophilin family peptidyl-prolyl cis-trans isomerase
VQAIAAALGRSRSPQAVDLLKELWDDTAPEIQAGRPAILKALRDQGVVDFDDGITKADAAEKIGPAAFRYQPEDYQRIARTVGRRIRMETSAGTMEIALDYRNAALTAENFTTLVEKGFFDGQRFVEVLPGQFMKAGIPPGGSGASPIAAIRSEINTQPFLRGSLGMAEKIRDSASTGFFICLSPQPLADGRYTNFGRLISGDDLLDRMTVETRIVRMTVLP